MSVFFEEMKKNNIEVSLKQQERIESRLNEVLDYEPKIGVFGKTGVGKSSLCNALFGKDICEISDVEACTREPEEVLLKMGGNGIRLIDVPGVGENRERDEEYKKLYAKLLPELDLILWVIKADDRAMSSDEMFYKELVKHHIDEGKPFFFVLNQVDKIEPFREWNEKSHEPSNNQKANIDNKIKYLSDSFDVPESRIIAVSANEKYNLIRLVDEFISALPKERQITTYIEVAPELQSESTGRVVKESFLDVILDTVGDVISTTGEKIMETFFKAGDKIVDKVCDKIDKIGRFFESIWPF